MKKSKSSKRKQMKWQQYIAVLLFMVIGGICGVIIGQWMSRSATYDRPLGETLLFGGVMILIMYGAMLVQIVIHEAGHLLFGLLTGYQFSSFRIFSVMWVRQEGKLCRKKLSLAGTGGQCLMAPPDMVEGKIPTVLYNLGGSILNTAAGLVFLGLYYAVRSVPVLAEIFLFLTVIGFGFAIVNGVPMRLGTVDNDGYNALSLRKNREAMEAFWMQMKVNDQLSRGIRLKDMPEEWFLLPREEALQNSLVATVGVFACNRLMDGHRFEEADELMERMISMETGMVGLYHGLMVCDRMYVELITENRQRVLDEMLTKEQKKAMKQMKQYPSILRTRYALALLSEKDREKAEKVKAEFEKMARTYPYKTDIESERELMKIAETVS